jgi:hypothetical protein
VTSPSPRGLRWLGRAPVLTSLVTCALTYWFTAMLATYRLPGHHASLALVTGATLVLLTLAVLVFRVMTSSPPPRLRRALGFAERHAVLIVLWLTLASLLVPLAVFVLVFRVVPGMALVTAVGTVWIMTKLVFALFVAGVLGLVALPLARSLRSLAGRYDGLRRLGVGAHVALVTAVIAYCATALVFVYIGSFDATPAVAYRSVVRGVSTSGDPLGLLSLSWVDVASWRSAGANERVLLFPSRDQLWPGRIPAGLPVVVTVRTGFFGVQWVHSVSRDDDQLAERLLEAVPTARLPRRRLIETRLRERRWADAAAHARKYLEHYPRDREFAGRVAAALRGAGHAQAAAGLEPRTR